jgi:hypothetical protein
MLPAVSPAYPRSCSRCSAEARRSSSGRPSATSFARNCRSRGGLPQGSEFLVRSRREDSPQRPQSGGRRALRRRAPGPRPRADRRQGNPQEARQEPVAVRREFRLPARCRPEPGAGPAPPRGRRAPILKVIEREPEAVRRRSRLDLRPPRTAAGSRISLTGTKRTSDRSALNRLVCGSQRLRRLADIKRPAFAAAPG